MPKKLDDIFTPENVRLFNMLFRHQVYLEGVKTNIARNYDEVLRNLFSTFATFLAQTRYTKLDQFTRGQLAEFVRRFQVEQTKFYSAYTEKLIAVLKDFLATDVEVTNSMFAVVVPPLNFRIANLPVTVSQPVFDNLPIQLQSLYVPTETGFQLSEEAQSRRNAEPIFEGDTTSGSAAANVNLWENIQQEPIPASGLSVDAQIRAFTNYAMFAFIALIRKAYANGWTTQEMFEALAGEVNNRFAQGLLAKFGSQNQSMINTVLQHISSNVQAAVASDFFERYQWVAVLDNRTTVICLSRDGNIYIYGEGPLPPAHYNCRSKAVPIQGNQKIHSIPESYYSWLKEQPKDVLDDMIGPSKASGLLNGQLTAKDFTSIASSKPLTLTQFKQKLRYILGE